MIVKLSAEQIKALGLQSAGDFQNKLSALIADNQQLKAMADTAPNMADLLKRLEALEARPASLTEARINELITAGNASTVKAAETAAQAVASKTVTDALAAVGTTPAKPSPAPAAQESPEAQAANLVKAGKYEEAYAANPALRAEFPTAKSYAAFMKNAKNVRINQRTN